MKLRSFKASAPVLALALAASACDQGLTDLNQNPNAPEDVPASSLLANSIRGSVGQILGANFNMTLTGLWSQQVAKIQYIDEDRYDLRDGTVNFHWQEFYSGSLADLKVVAEKGDAANAPNYTAVANIMQSWIFQNMTDVWGDIPYSQALQGRASEPVLTPAYDAQEDIYKGMLATLKAANANISVGGNAITDGDLIYRGDMAKWKKFANSLRLRMAMRMSDVKPAEARSEFVAALAAGVFTSNGDNATLNYGANAPSQNPIHVNFQTRFDHVISATMVDTLKSLSDPRLGIYATPAPSDGAFRGMRNGLTNDHGIKFTTLSRLGDYFRAPDAPAVLQSYAEVLFLQAEAAARGWIPGNAAELYRAGIQASMQQYGVPTAEINAYLAQPRVQYSAGTGLQQIAVQKWIALFMNGPEAYAEWRRTGFPMLAVVPASVNGSRIPVRVFYPSSEQSFNKKNLDVAAGRNGGMTLNDRVWWDVR